MQYCRTGLSNPRPRGEFSILYINLILSMKIARTLIFKWLGWGYVPSDCPPAQLCWKGAVCTKARGAFRGAFWRTFSHIGSGIGIGSTPPFATAVPIESLYGPRIQPPFGGYHQRDRWSGRDWSRANVERSLAFRM